MPVPDQEKSTVAEVQSSISESRVTHINQIIPYSENIEDNFLEKSTARKVQYFKRKTEADFLLFSFRRVL
ncbi:hypothetical protein TNCV_1224331 [Trichonephila clavipes]|nr:hypothetical protein TNCV_1224331 [Trichonephila clavipes]